MKRTSPVLPGSVIGILGGGQLGRMTAMAARSFGYRVQVLDPEPACPARFVVDTCICAEFSDARAASGLSRGSDVVTFEIESIPPDALRAVASYAPLRPSLDALCMVQDRGLQKNWLQRSSFPCGPFQIASTAAELEAALRTLGPRCFVKSCRGGYDGRGQMSGIALQHAESLFAQLGNAQVVVEKSVDVAAELSVQVARRPSGEMAVFPVAFNHHEDRILRWSVLPAAPELVAPSLTAQAQDLALTVAEQLGLEGLLTVELFVTQQGTLLVNELALRPHNTFHSTERATGVSQFEQHVRAVCDLPLGDVTLLRPAAIINLLGDLWLNKEPPDMARMLGVPSSRLHLYEKRTPKPGRKMGHLSALGDTPMQARDRVLLAYQLLTEPKNPTS